VSVFCTLDLCSLAYLSLPHDIDTTSSIRESPSWSLVLARQVGRLEILDVCLHFIGIVDIMG
jgi:hypothetical protein